MQRTHSRFEADLRMPPRPVVLLFLVPAIALVSVASKAPDPRRMLGLAYLLYPLVAALWLLDGWKPQLGRWATVGGLIVFIGLTRTWFPVPGFLILLSIPTVLAAALIGLVAASVTAALESGMLISMAALLPQYATTSETHIALAAIWVALGVAWQIYRPIYDLAQWSWEHFEQAQSLLEQARDRQAELKSTLDALGYANRQLALTNEKLAAMRLVAEEAKKNKAAFVANVSHEFRTPLNIIIGLTEILLDAPQVYGEELTPHVRRDMQIVYRNCEYLSTMINDVLDLSQVEAERLALHREWLSIADLIDGALTIVRPLVDEKGLELQVSVPADLPQIYCDPRRIRQVILNLVSNAARFTESGSVAIKACVQAQYIAVSVSDTGPGIAPEDASRIFEPFQQASANLPGHGQGSGLGLSISKQFVDLHDGRMWLEANTDTGSTFSFRLPISPLIGPTAPPQRWITEGWVERTTRAEVPSAQLDQRMILCDKTGEIYPVFSRYADRVEFVDTREIGQVPKVLEESPAQALVINEETPARLWSTIRQARAMMPDVPIVGCALPPSALHALSAGAKGYLLKPLKREDLKQALDAAAPVRRVLVVDDEPDALYLLTQMLHILNGSLDVVACASGKQALEEMRRVRFDLVLLDIILPDMDGWQVLDAKAQDELTRDIPVVLVSAQDPRDQPLASELVVATMGGGLSISKVLRCCRQLSALLLQPD